MAYEIEYSETAERNLRAIPVMYRRRLRIEIREQLLHQPTVPTRQRKRLRVPNALDAEWELRIQPYRVYYNVDENEKVVWIIAVGHKPRNEVFVDGEKVDL